MRPKEAKTNGAGPPSTSHHSFVTSNTRAKSPTTMISNRSNNSEISNAFLSRYATRNEAKKLKTHYYPGEISGELCDLNTRKNWTSMVNAEMFQQTEEPLTATARMNIIKTNISEAGWSQPSSQTCLKQKKQQVIM